MHRLVLLCCLISAAIWLLPRADCAATAVDESPLRLFDKRNARYCFKGEHERIVRLNSNSNEKDCAAECLKIENCQGFIHVSNNGGKDCKMAVFGRCSQNIQPSDCSNWAQVWVRNHFGLPRGDLCPKEYSNKFGNSYYKAVPVSNWHDARRICLSEPGLTKFADVESVQEMDHLRSVQRKGGSDHSFYVDAHATDTTGTAWASASCNRRLLKELWEPGQPNSVKEGHLFTDFWHEHKRGLDSTNADDPAIKLGLCECVNPF